MCLLFILALSFYAELGLVAGQNTNLNAASDAINNAFDTLSAAEKAGADVGSLVTQLNSASRLLSEAENSYRNGDTNAVKSKTSSAVIIARQVTAAAQTAKDKAESAGQSVFWSTLGLTIIGVSVLGLVLMLVWRFIRHRYAEKLVNHASMGY